MISQDDARHEPGTGVPPGPTGGRVGTDRPDERTTGELLKDLSQQLTTLVHEEVELAKSEMGTKASQAAKGAGALSGAAVLAVLGLGALVAAAVAGLHEVLAVWLSALIIGAALLAVAGLAALVGKSKVSQGTPPVPTEAAESTKEDVEWLKTHARSARQ